MFSMAFKSFAALCFFSLSVGCIYSAERGRLLEGRVDRLEIEKKELEQSLKKQKNLLDGQVAEVQNALEKLDHSARRTGADIGIQVEQLQSEFSNLRGQLEQIQHQQAQMQANFSPNMPSESDSQASSIKRPVDKEEFAELVENKLTENPNVGRELASEWLKKWPRDSKASTIHFLLGTSYFDNQEWRAALSEYGEIVKNFSKSAEAPRALLQSADCFIALKMPREARLVLQEILRSYPQSEVVSEARTKLSKLSKRKKP
jgi:TolA-binding protein